MISTNRDPRNPDPITGTPGCHAVGAGVGAAAGTVAGTAVGAGVGTAMAAGAAVGTPAGPFGTMVGAFLGGLALGVGGGFAGKAIAEKLEPTFAGSGWDSTPPAASELPKNSGF